jgi:hypothetical protein
MKGFENGKQGSSRIAQTYIPEPNKKIFIKGAECTTAI